MPLTNIEYGSLASSEIMNDNFSYLDNKITTVSNNLSSASSNIYSSIAGLSSSVTEKFDDIDDELDNLGNELSELNEAFLNSKITPDYSLSIAVNYSSGDAVGFDGWLLINLINQTPNNDMWAAINNSMVVRNCSGPSGSAGYTAAGMVMVSAADIITFSSATVVNCYKVPFKGGQE